ncbi:MAG: hypothetical protein U0X91_26565 [Spirosomataceae bacterium]
MESFLDFLTNTLKINTVKYSVPVIVLFMTGTWSWIFTYVVTIIGIRKYKIVEIPAIAAAFNLSWEFCWGFLLKSDYGAIFSYFCILWFFMDCYINFHVLKFGRKLVTHYFIKKYYLIIYVFFLISGCCITYFIRQTHVDDGVGIISSYFICLIIGSSYIYQLLYFSEYRGKGFSYLAAWGKFIGTGMVSIGAFLLYPNNHFVHTMCIIVFVLDSLYIYLFKHYTNSPIEPIR